MVPPSDKSQSSISSFFKPAPSSSAPQKRPEVIDLSLSSSDSESSATAPPPRPLKKPKLEETAPIFRPTASTSSSAVPLKAAGQRVAKFRFDPLDTSAQQSAPSQKELKRREQYAATLLAGHGRNLLKRKSIYLQSEHYLAAHPEANGSSSAVGSEDAEDEDMVDDEDVNVPEAGKGKGKGQGVDGEEEVTPSRFAHFAAKVSSVKGKGKEVAPKVKYTPLEQQVIALKKSNPGVVLLVEVGYKYRFFEEDAQTASKVLGIACFPSKSMLNASIPSHRLNIHIKRLINAGHKVGVVRQMETAALKKVSDNRSAPFTRSLSALYTSATYIDELAIDSFGSTSSASSTILCLVEETPAKGQDQRVKLGLLAVVPSTGDIIYDEFDDGHMRSELETRMLHLQPSELVLQKDLSKQTESMVAYLIGKDARTPGFTCRTERIKNKLSVQAATTYISNYFSEAARKNPDSDEIVIDEDPVENEELNRILDLPKSILIALAALMQHLKDFALDSMFLHTASFTHFSNQAVMHLNGNTLANLEILRNQTDYQERGSLLSILDHCKTPFGRRLMRKWVAKPLVSLTAVNERLDAVSEIVQKSSTLVINKLRELFRGLPDLERGLVRISLGNATPQELLKVLQALSRVADVFEAVDEDDHEVMKKGSIQSPVLRKIVVALPKIKPQVDKFLARIVASEAREGKKADLFKDPDLFENVQDAKDCLGAVEYELQDQLKSVRKIVKKPNLEFIKVAEQEFLIELRINESKKVVPDNWIKINSTKHCYRFRTPEMQKKIEELEQARETLAAEANTAYLDFLQQVSECYDTFRAAISSLATADCLFSLAVTATSPGYCRPEIVSTPGVLDIKAGRHPMVEVLLSDPFVPNDVSLGGASTKTMILTGLNMGGKSSLSRSVALIALMAQIGSYVPADSCRTSLFDGIYTRMGASDELARGRSTFMVELSETSEILKLATPRSLIILDELGRGTSTMDGQAIASAVLQYIVTHSQSLCIFVTHYPSLAEVSKRFPDSVSCHHMSCLEKDRKDGFADVVFLYKLAQGLASKSHGLNVARMAELPESVIKKAFEKSQELESVFEKKARVRMAERMEKVLKALVSVGSEGDMSKSRLLDLCGEILHQV